MARSDRPGGVTLVAVLTWISGALDIVGGSILLFQRSDASIVEEFGGENQLMASAIFAILIGVVVVAVAGGLLRGNPSARIVVTIFQVLSIVSSIFLGIAYPPGAIGEYVSIAVALVVLFILWSRRAGAFFRQ